MVVMNYHHLQLANTEVHTAISMLKKMPTKHDANKLDGHHGI